MKPRIIISISGGVVSDVVSDQPIDVTLVDWDNIKEGGETEPYDGGSNYPTTDLNRRDFDIAYSKIIGEVNEVIQRNIDEEEK